MKSRNRLAVLGGFTQRNVGDDLLGLVIREHLPSAILLSVEGGTLDGTAVEPVERLPALAPQIDLLMIGGGGLLYYGYIRRLPLRSFPKPFGFLSVGIPHAGWLRGLEETVASAEFVTLRDPLAVAMFRDAFPGIACRFLPDPVFLLPASPRRSGPSDTPTILLNARTMPEGWMRPGETTSMLDDQIESYNALISRFEGRATFLGLGFEEKDAPLLEKLACPFRIVGFRTAVELIANADAMVATRLHAGIISATQGTPFVLIDYQDKVRGLASVLELEDACFRLDDVDGVHDFVASIVEQPRRADTARARALGRQVAAFLQEVSRVDLLASVPSWRTAG